ncbi:toxin [Spirochaetota bacterium]
MVIFDWNKEKNQSLILERGISFEDVVVAVTTGKDLDLYNHPNVKKYPNQYILVVEINSYAYIVPLIINDDGSIFLKTIIPSRKATKTYLEV